jgi:hypothetical protein
VSCGPVSEHGSKKAYRLPVRLYRTFFVTNFGTFQIPVDSAEETSGGEMMVIARES